MLFFIVLCETGLVVAPFLPGDSLILGSASLASTGLLNIYTLWLVIVCAAIMGDALNFSVGKWLGKDLFKNPNSKWLNPRYLHQAQIFYQKHGGKTIVLARFMPVLRSFVPFVAGMSKIPYPKFLTYNVLGALLWVSFFSTLGYFLGQLPIVQKHLSAILLLVILLSALPFIIAFIKGIMLKK
ncbi:MAG: VTT domain-containing protein [Neisseriaceae bacterium]